MPGMAPRRSTRGARGPLFLLLLIAAACAQILDTEGIVIKEPEAAPPPRGPAPVCLDQELHCEGAALQICRDDGRGFRTARICSSAELCCDDPSACPASPGCQPPQCTAGDFRCDGAVLQVCNEGLTGWTPITTCPSAAQCNASLGRCSDTPCNPAAPDRQCSSSQLLECQASGWAAVRDCDTRALCNDAATGSGCRMTGCVDARGPSGTVVPSPFRCNNGDLFRCNDDLTAFEFVETCLNLFHCSDLRDVIGDPQAAALPLADLARLGCTPPACTPGKYVCEGSKLMRCNLARTAYQELQDCGSPGRCNASAGSCEPEDCMPGRRQCSGRELQTCSEARIWQTTETCAGAAQCSLEGCQPAVCEVTEYRCNGATLERCNIDGTDWIPVHGCATAQLCNAAAKRCDAPLCNPNDQRCSRDGKLQRCAEGRNAWDIVNDCAALARLTATAPPGQVAASCDPSGSGRCNNPPSCTAGSLRCNGQYLERCRDNTWQPQQRCATAALCDATGMGACRMPSCTPGEYRCVTPGVTPSVAEQGDPLLGLTLQVCDSTGMGWANVRDCPADNYCDALHGQCDLCDPLEPLCFGPSVYLCSADGQERELEQACTSGCIIAPDDQGRDRPTCREDVATSSAASAP